MKTKLFLFAIPCFVLASCNGSADKEEAKKLTDSITAARHFDSLQNAIKAMKKQDSIDAAKAADTGKKTEAK